MTGQRRCLALVLAWKLARLGKMPHRKTQLDRVDCGLLTAVQRRVYAKPMDNSHGPRYYYGMYGEGQLRDIRGKWRREGRVTDGKRRQPRGGEESIKRSKSMVQWFCICTCMRMYDGRDYPRRAPRGKGAGSRVDWEERVQAGW